MTFIESTLSAVVSKLGISSAEEPPYYHPLDPLTASEIARSVDAIRHTANGARLWFKSIQLVEPPKAILVPWLDEYAAGEAVSRLDRTAEILVGRRHSKGADWLVYQISLPETGSSQIISAEPVPAGQHVPPDMGEMMAAEEALLNNPTFKAAIAKLDLPSNAKVVADGWIYGADTLDATPRSIPFMVYLSFSDNPDTCHYAAPLPIVPVISADTFELQRLDYCPIYGKGDKTLLDLDGRFPWEAYVPNEYDQNIRATAGLSSREDIKPYRVLQPEGASFTLEGRVIRWQKWAFHIGFNYREGIVLSDIRYDGRSTFYRLSVSDMTVPYGDPRAPFHRKQAFDLGDIGAGLTANELALGCDCLGEIAYLNFDHFSQDGSPTLQRGVVCIHEQDDGIGWKHTNFRTNRPSVTRSRILIIQTIITVANYEYIFAWRFDQAAGISLEVRATGILSTVAILPGETSPHGNVVSPGVLATNHQHLFSVRIDPAIDGHNNTVVQEDSVAMPFDKANPPSDNKWGVGYTVEQKAITKSGWADAAPEKNRVFKITNPNKVNPVSGKNVAYKLVPAPSQLMLAHPESIAYARAEFGEHHIYVTSYKDRELYAGGLYTNQSNGDANGLRSWVARDDNVDNADLVVWHTFGLTHNPRVEDFPVMPCEIHMIHLKPNDFFTASPAIDVPASTQAFNQSQLHNPGQHLQGDNDIEEKAKANGLNKQGCCA
ncbi:hypothetical protein L486_05318 [Kwoniella mangroviensis CBS 10435]|uniref:Amine oxidase n=1 Tax=Kwoniella mangroviensis CBS 10435 TaxID=1331196 RepID=A0A1B9IQN5_9TREE|nr:uncharacterized protein I203_08427 [Kwoniella mangroviensis CBS 8507]OCF57853.1 hypothetical protein L486_05318 [Kwoniella mangroviensis CBS 10435]OCF62503.1 hypothetical protein I203_08427 [Kwoniella mangroviensis CBS 8507]